MGVCPRAIFYQAFNRLKECHSLKHNHTHTHTLDGEIRASSVMPDKVEVAMRTVGLIAADATQRSKEEASSESPSKQTTVLSR